MSYQWQMTIVKQIASIVAEAGLDEPNQRTYSVHTSLESAIQIADFCSGFAYTQISFVDSTKYDPSSNKAYDLVFTICPKKPTPKENRY